MLNDLSYTSNESLYYSYLLNENGFNTINDSISGANVVKLFLKSKLDKGALKKIWDLSSVRKAPDLNKLEFFYACRFVALAQRGEELNHQNAVSLNYKDVMPKFEGVYYDPNKRKGNSTSNNNNFNSNNNSILSDNGIGNNERINKLSEMKKKMLKSHYTPNIRKSFRKTQIFNYYKPFMVDDFQEFGKYE